MKNKKKWLGAFPLALLAVCCGVLFVSCNNSAGSNDITSDSNVSSNGAENATLGEHIHKWGEWEVLTPATCTATGTEQRACADDPTHTETRDVAMIDHTESAWIVDKEAMCEVAGSRHTECTVCHTKLQTEEIPPKGPHNYENGVCTICGELKPSEGLAFAEFTSYSTVTGIGTCTDRDVVIPKTYNGKPVLWIEREAFKNRDSLTSVVIPEGALFICDAAFYGCKSLNSITIPNTVESIDNLTFSYCCSLARVTIPDSVTSIGEWAFSDCSSLTSIEIPNSVTSIAEGAFSYCTNLTRVEIPNSVTSVGSYVFSSCSSLTSVEIPSSVTSIGEWAFYGCSSLTSVTIPDSVTSIQKAAFSSCSGLAGVTLGKGVASIGEGVFFNCSSLANIAVDENNTAYSDIEGVLFNKDRTTLLCYPAGKQESSYTIADSVTSVGEYAFEHCTNLTSVTIGNSVASIGEYAFSWCNGLKSVALGNGVTSIGDGAFSYCRRLASVAIPDSVTSIGYKVFYYCVDLTSIEVDENNTAYSSIDGVLFNKDKTTLVCYPAWKQGSSYAIPNSVTSIEEWAFAQCIPLKSVTIGNSVTSIGVGAFYGSSLKSVTIGNSVRSIEDSTFAYCDKLTSVYYAGTEEEWNEIAIGSSNEYLTSATRYYYSESEPTVSGKWWHDADGVPAVWAIENDGSDE